MTRRATLTTFILASALALAGLLIAAASDHRDTAFSLRVPNNRPVVPLPPGRTLCQGPITAQAGFSSIEMWARPLHSLELRIRSLTAGGIDLTRTISGSSTPSGELTVALGPGAVAARSRFTVCVRNTGPRRIAFEGGAPSAGSGAFEISGKRGHDAIALAFLRRRGPSLLSLLPTVFRRASLFKLSSVGAWTFWVLLAALLGAFAIAGWAVRAAASADEKQLG
jgi:hypothetical protein